MRALVRRLVLSTLVAGCPVAGQATDFGQPVFEAVDAAALKGIQRVAVTSFTVQYVLKQVWDTSHTTGGSGYGIKLGGSAVSTGMRQTAGQGGGFDIQDALDPARMQSTTDKLYQDFMADLKAAGFEVVTPEQLSASKAFKAYASHGPAVPRKEEATAEKGNGAGAITSVFYTPAGIPLVDRKSVV